MWDPHYTEKENYGVVFQNFGLSGCAKNKIGSKNGPSYDNATKIFNIKSLCYQRINCKTFFKLWSEKCKILSHTNHDILTTMVTKRTRWPHFFLSKFMSGTLKESLYQIWGKFIEGKLRDRITLTEIYRKLCRYPTNLFSGIVTGKKLGFALRAAELKPASFADKKY